MFQAPSRKERNFFRQAPQNIYLGVSSESVTCRGGFPCLCWFPALKVDESISLPLSMWVIAGAWSRSSDALSNNRSSVPVIATIFDRASTRERWTWMGPSGGSLGDKGSGIGQSARVPTIFQEISIELHRGWNFHGDKRRIYEEMRSPENPWSMIYVCCACDWRRGGGARRGLSYSMVRRSRGISVQASNLQFSKLHWWLQPSSLVSCPNAFCACHQCIIVSVKELTWIDSFSFGAEHCGRIPRSCFIYYFV